MILTEDTICKVTCGNHPISNKHGGCVGRSCYDCIWEYKFSPDDELYLEPLQKIKELKHDTP